MFIAVYGAGYVGLVSAACFASLGHDVVCVDINQEKVDLLNQGGCPIFENDLPELLKQQIAIQSLRFTTDYKLAVQQAAVHFIAVGTPSLPDGSADLSQVFDVALHLAKLSRVDSLIVVKSTVPVGTGDLLQQAVDQAIAQTDKQISIQLVSNPEFLREGTAVYDFLNADRIVVGGNTAALKTMEALYEPLVKQGIPLLNMSRRSAELTKYAANAMLATKISFINHVSQLAERFEANVDEVRNGISLDQRIGPHFLQPGIGYGGSCFPKDVRALSSLAKQTGVDTCLLDAVESINQTQKYWVVKQIKHYFNNKIEGLKIGIWGLAFKPGTDDLREASSLVVLDDLASAGVELWIHDPAALTIAQQRYANYPNLHWCQSSSEVLDQSLDALVILTEWHEFKTYPLPEIKKALHNAPIIDGRNCYSLQSVTESQLNYISVGRPAVLTN